MFTARYGLNKYGSYYVFKIYLPLFNFSASFTCSSVMWNVLVSKCALTGDLLLNPLLSEAVSDDKCMEVWVVLHTENTTYTI